MSDTNIVFEDRFTIEVGHCLLLLLLIPYTDQQTHDLFYLALK